MKPEPLKTAAGSIPRKLVRSRTLLIANPSSDVYGSDLQMLQTVAAARNDGWRVIVAVPERGELTPALEELGAEIRCIPCPVLRRSSSSPRGVLSLGATVASTIPRLVREIRSIDPDVVYVNTETIPWWLAAARAARVPTVCHVHEAEAQDARIVRTGLNLPLLAASRIITISKPAAEAINLPSARARAHLIYNGVPGPDGAVEDPPASDPFRFAVVGRLSPRKAPHVALDGVALARSRGRHVTLDVCGTPFAGYEWYERELKTRAERADLAGAVRFVGYVSPIWSTLAQVNGVLAPSLREPFGNAVVEAQLARRPVIASASMGHLETVLHEETGLLVPPDNAEGMAAAIERIMDDEVLRDNLIAHAEKRAIECFSVERYHSQVVEVLTSMVKRS